MSKSAPEKRGYPFERLGKSGGLYVNPAHAGIHYAKPQLLTDTFQLPKRGGKKKQKPAPRANNTKKRTPPKDPVPKKAPLTPEARRERQRIRHKEKLERARLSGQCRHCGEPAIPSQTRCETCAEKHRVSRRLNDAKRNEKTKELRKSMRASAEAEDTATSGPTKCRHCKEPPRPGQTRCERCAKRHNEYRRRSEAKKKAAARPVLSQACNLA